MRAFSGLAMLAASVFMKKRGGYYNQPTYKYYVVNRINRKIESGWDFREDAVDRQKELRTAHGIFRVFAKRTVLMFGIDPNDDNNWIKGPVT